MDSAGNAIVTGSTDSSDFPTVNARYSHLWGFNDAFVTKFNATGSQVLYSTYLGGSRYEFGSGIAVDNAGNATVTGNTYSSDFPTVNAKYPHIWGTYDAFVTKFNTSGSQVLYSTYLGGSGGDSGKRIVVDSAGNVYVTGFTISDDFPTHANDAGIISYDSSYNGGGDVFVVKLTAANSALPKDQADISIALTRTGNTEPVYSGDSVALDISIVNHGPALARNVIVRLTPPAGATLSTSEPDCTVNPALTCQLGDIAKGNVFGLSLKLTVQSKKSETLKLTASALTNTYDAKPANNASTFNLPINSNVAVILVHGFIGSPASFSGDGKFLDKNNLDCSANPQQGYLVNGCLPHFGRLLKDDARLLVAQPFDYSDKTPPGTSIQWNIERLAGELHKHIECVLRGDCMYPKGTKVDRVDIVAHSMGGLITRAYIAGMAKDADNSDAAIAYNGKIRRIITAGTPHYGSNVQKLINYCKIILISNPAICSTITELSQIKQLTFGSPFIWKLNSLWKSRVVTPGIFKASNLLTVSGTTNSFSCSEGVIDGPVYIPSATLPNDASYAFLPDTQIRYTPYPHTHPKFGLCSAVPPLVGVAPGHTTHLTYQLAKYFFKGETVPNFYTPSASIRNNALLLVVIADSVTKKPINPAPIFGSKASLKLDGRIFPSTPNSGGGALTAVPIPLTGSQQTVTLQIIPPSGYQIPASTQVTLKAGRPTVRLIFLVPKL